MFMALRHAVFSTANALTRGHTRPNVTSFLRIFAEMRDGTSVLSAARVNGGSVSRYLSVRLRIG